MTNNQLALFCLVDGEATSYLFSIKIYSSDTVEDLKTLIKAKNTNDFRCRCAQLTLWRVSIPVTDDDDEVPILLDNLPEKKKLEATAKLSSVFDTDLPEGTINILVLRPLQSMHLFLLEALQLSLATFRTNLFQVHR